MVILITGASRGIGREIAITLSKEGHKIIANYNKSEEQAKELEKQNTNIEIFKADVSKRNEVQNMVQEIIKKYEQDQRLRLLRLSLGRWFFRERKGYGVGEL